MSKRKYSPLPVEQSSTFSETQLPISDLVAVYYRQSTMGQIGNISTSIQTIDMPAYLRRLGWADDKIILIDMDAGVSGMKRIDERDGMRQLFGLITERKVRAVACQDEDRLFRDVTQIQVNIFIEACRKACVLVITPSMVYNFADERSGTFHARQFRFKAEMAAEYISAIILGKMNRAKKRLMLEGRWAGAPVVPGYIVDNRRTLHNGQSNPLWRRYVPFAPHQQIVEEYFRLFLAYAGNVHATLTHIHERGPYYPDTKACPIPDGFLCVHQRKRYAKGYCPGRTGLVMLLTNAMVIGHWTVNGSVVIWNNHEPIIDQATFWQAFNYLSSMTLEGKPNDDYKPFAQQARPSLEKHRPVERPLFAGMMMTEHNGTLRKVGTVWLKDRKEYIYCFAERTPKERILWRRNAHFIDQKLVELVLDKLRATFAADVWQRSIETVAAEHYPRKRAWSAQVLVRLHEFGADAAPTLLWLIDDSVRLKDAYGSDWNNAYLAGLMGLCHMGAAGGEMIRPIFERLDSGAMVKHASYWDLTIETLVGMGADPDDMWDHLQTSDRNHTRNRFDRLAGRAVKKRDCSY